MQSNPERRLKDIQEEVIKLTNFIFIFLAISLAQFALGIIIPNILGLVVQVSCGLVLGDIYRKNNKLKKEVEQIIKNHIKPK